jgi:hypothetical protein
LEDGNTVELAVLPHNRIIADVRMPALLLDRRNSAYAAALQDANLDPRGVPYLVGPRGWGGIHLKALQDRHGVASPPARFVRADAAARHVDRRDVTYMRLCDAAFVPEPSKGHVGEMPRVLSLVSVLLRNDASVESIDGTVQ